VTFTYDERNRLTTGDGTGYTYTPRGTLATQTKAGATTQYTFDAFDQLIADGDSLYSYDVTDRMTSRIRGTAKQTFTYSGLGNDLAAITGGGTVQAKYARDLNGGLLGLKEGTGGAVAALSDLHGDLVATFTTSLQTSTAYDPFGTVTAQTGTKANLGYQGEYTHPDTGKVNMHARWYQPGTGTFISRDTMPQEPTPSVQANRYAYANASPLTGIDPTGHSTEAILPGGSLREAGSGNSGCISSGSICYETDSHARWWSEFVTSPGYDYLYSPQFSEEEIERLGHTIMPNGRPVDQPSFWFADDKVQNDYMSGWSPTQTTEELATSWILVGGMKSIQAMEKAAQQGVDDWRLIFNPKKANAGGIYTQVKKVPVGGVDAGQAAIYKMYSQYQYVVKYYRDIQKAAKNHGIDENVLAAVLMYESRWQHDQKLGAKVGDEVSFRLDNEGASVGVSQLEIYKVRHVFNRYVKGFAARDLSNRDIADMMKNPTIAIHAAAAYMRYLKEDIKGLHRAMTDMDAAIAYCTCSGAVMNPETGVITATRFVAWANSGYRDKLEVTPMHPENREIAEQRRKGLEKYWAAAPELFSCGRAACWTFQ
jgi:RHS repeat-associated protein